MNRRSAQVLVCALLLGGALVLAGCGKKGTLNASPSKLDFGDQALGSQSGIDQVTIENGDRGTRKILSVSIAGTNPKSFLLADGTTCAAGTELGKRDSCVVAIRFKPNALGPRSALLQVAHDGDSSPTEVELLGSGVGEPTVSLGATRMEFSTVSLGQTRTQQTTVTDTGNAPLELASIEIQGSNANDFAISKASTTCSTSTPVAAGASCTIAVGFSPKATGKRNASLVLEHNAKGSPSTIQLAGQGTGTAKLAVGPTALGFGTVKLGSTSKAKTVTVTNSGTAALTVIGLSVGGADPGDFRISGGSCSEGGSVGAGKSCTITVVFAPARSGSRAATLSIATSAQNQPVKVDLKGTGQSPSPPAGTTTNG